MSTDPPAERPLGSLRIFGWSAYLACSWTWCIGMFLPVLLVRDYGFWGFVVFAVPNVIGAAAVGWVVKSPGHSRRLVETHAFAMRWFSYVTIAFHAFWLTSLGPVLLARIGGTELPVPWVVVAVGVLVMVAALPPKTRVAAWRTALVVLAASAGAIGVFLWGGSAASEISDLRSQAGATAVFPIALSCAFGFLLCPHLDLTIHHAAQESGRARHTVFGLGFGVFFLAMILFTLAYSGVFLDRTENLTTLLFVAIAAHMLIQAWFTTSRHSHMLGSKPIAPVVAGLGASGVAFFFRDADWANDELIYRLFLSFYGLLFPAYVWLCMIPTRDGHAGIGGERGRHKLLVLALACIIAAPMFWMGFIARQELWLIPGVGVVLLARLFVRKNSIGAPG